MSPNRWLRISYRVGAAVDAVAAVQMLRARLFGLGMGISGSPAGEDYRYAMGMGAALMLGWTALLLWADRRPLQRRGVLLLTVVVVAGLAANELVAVRAGFLPIAPVAAIWTLQAALIVLFLRSYVVASRGAALQAKASDPE